MTKRKPKFRIRQAVWLDTSEGLLPVSIENIINLQKYEVYNNGFIELVHRGSLYESEEEYKKVMKKYGYNY